MDYRSMAEELAISFKDGQKKLPADLMQGERGILANLFASEKGLLSGEISDAVGLSSGRTSTAIKSLEKKGYVERSVDTRDARQVRVALTKEGQLCAKKNLEEILQFSESLLERLGEKDATEYVRIMKRISSL